MKRNAKLKGELYKRQVRLKDLSQATGIPKPYISLNLSGRYNFDDAEKRRIAKYLKVDVGEIFAE